MAFASVRGMERHLRHPARTHSGARQTRRGVSATRATASARGAAPERAGLETLPLPAPDGSGALVVALDLHRHRAVAEHSDGRTHHIPLAPDRPVGEVTREVLAAVSDLVGPVRFDLKPQETPWTTPLDEDSEHRTYNPTQVNEYFAAATQAALGARGPACAVSRAINPRQCLVGQLRPRS